MHGLHATVESQGEARECGNNQAAALSLATAALPLTAQCLFVSWSSRANPTSHPSCSPIAHGPAFFSPCKSKCFACCISCPAPSTEIRVYLCCTCGVEAKPPVPCDAVGDCQEELQPPFPADSRNRESCLPQEISTCCCQKLTAFTRVQTNEQQKYRKQVMSYEEDQ